MYGIEEVLNVLMIEMNKCIWYILCCLSCGRGVLKRKLKIGRLEVFLNAYAGICKFGKVRKTEETLTNFSEKSKCLKKKKKQKKFTTSLPHYFLKIC